MKLTQVKGNTWVIEAHELIPFYRLEDGRCILLDAGLYREREELDRSLRDAGLTPAALICSHAHVDHSGCATWLREKYRIPVAMTQGEAAVIHSSANLKAAMTLTPARARGESYMIFTPDILLPDGDSELELLGVPFRIIHTPGHSPSHICTITPDNVCYAGDALLSQEMYYAKLPYSMDIEADLESKQKLAALDCEVCIAAHRGVFTDIGAVVQANRDLFLTRAEEILSVVDHPISFSELAVGVYQKFSLFSHNPFRAQSFERNIRFFVEYLLDRGDLTIVAGEDGAALFVRSQNTP